LQLQHGLAHADDDFDEGKEGTRHTAIKAWCPGIEGVGEHVRIRSHFGRSPLVRLQTEQRSAPNEEILFLLPDRPAAAKLP